MGGCLVLYHAQLSHLPAGIAVVTTDIPTLHVNWQEHPSACYLSDHLPQHCLMSYLANGYMDVQEPEVWDLLKKLEIAAKEHDTGYASLLFATCLPATCRGVLY